MTSSLPRYVVDASVAAKWHLRDEPDVSAADAVLADYRDGRTRLVAPDQIRYEVPSAIRNAVRQQRLTPVDGAAAVTEFLSWRLPTVRDDALIEAAFDQSVRFGCSLYDGLYLALAEAYGCPLVYADLRLGKTLAARFPLALWIDYYVPVA